MSTAEHFDISVLVFSSKGAHWQILQMLTREGKTPKCYVFSKPSVFTFLYNTGNFWIIYVIGSFYLTEFIFLLHISIVVQHFMGTVILAAEDIIASPWLLS